MGKLQQKPAQVISPDKKYPLNAYSESSHARQVLSESLKKKSVLPAGIYIEYMWTNCLLISHSVRPSKKKCGHTCTVQEGRNRFAFNTFCDGSLQCEIAALHTYARYALI